MNKLLSSLTIFGVSLLLCGISYGADCSSLANQVAQVRATLEEFQAAADGYSQASVVRSNSIGISASALNGGNPYSAKVDELKQILAAAEQDYNNCLNNNMNDAKQNIYETFYKIINMGEQYYNQGIKYWDQQKPTEAYGSFMSGYAMYYGALKIYNDANYEIQNMVDERYDIKSLVSNSYSLIGTNLCMMGYKKQALEVLQDAIDLNNQDAKEIYNSCKSIKDEDADSLRCIARYGEHNIIYKNSDGEKVCKCEEGYTKDSQTRQCVENTDTKRTNTSSTTSTTNKDNLTEDELYCLNKYGENSVPYKGADGKTHCTCGENRMMINGSCTIVNQEQADAQCVKYYGANSIGVLDRNSLWSCSCKKGYKMENNKSCVVDPTSSVINGFSEEFNKAYQFAFEKKITTMPTIEEANMHGEIIRAEISKMLANWVKSLGKTPDTTKACNFKDISGVKGDLYTAVIESCQLGIMGQGINEFRPFDKITKGEVATAVSRIIWGTKNDGGTPFYQKHINALKNEGVINDITNPEVNEIRGNVMLMLMKASDTDELISCDDPGVQLACGLSDDACPDKCR